jgi:hypothetical protein
MGFFKQFSKAIGKDDKGECFGNCNSLQTPEHLRLHCKHYIKERKKMNDALNTPLLTLQLLFITAKGSAALVAFLEKTKIATVLGHKFVPPSSLSATLASCTQASPTHISAK